MAADCRATDCHRCPQAIYVKRPGDRSGHQRNHAVIHRLPIVNPDESNALGEGIQAADLERDSVVDRFKVARDDEMIGSLSFDILECGRGTLRLVQPSRRGYERYYLAVAIVVVAFALP